MLKPINNKIIIELIEKENKTKSGIIVNNYSNEKQAIGKIIAISEDINLEDLKINKEIIFDKYSGMDIKFEEKDYIIIDIKDILAVIEK